MASLAQLHKDWYEKLEEVKQLNVDLSSKQVEYEFYDKEISRFRKEMEQRETELLEREAAVTKQQEEIKLTLARTESEIQKNIDRLNNEIILKQGRIKELDADILARQEEVAEVVKRVKSLQKDAQALLLAGEEKVEAYAQLSNQLEARKRELGDIETQLTEARADLETVREDARNLTQLKHDLDMYYRRIKNYYKKAGLNFIDKQYVGIPSN